MLYCETCASTGPLGHRDRTQSKLAESQVAQVWRRWCPSIKSKNVCDLRMICRLRVGPHLHVLLEAGCSLGALLVSHAGRLVHAQLHLHLQQLLAQAVVPRHPLLPQPHALQPGPAEFVLAAKGKCSWLLESATQCRSCATQCRICAAQRQAGCLQAETHPYSLGIHWSLPLSMQSFLGFELT